MRRARPCDPMRCQSMADGVNVNVNETDWHDTALAVKEAVSVPILGPRRGNSVNGFSQRVTCAYEVSTAWSISMGPSHPSIPRIYFSSVSPRRPGGISKRTGKPAGSARASAWCARSILVRASQAEMDDFVAGIEIDPEFPGLRRRCCRRRGHSIAVVSDGLDRTVDAVLRRHDLDLPYYANHLEWRGDDRWRLTFPHARSDCQALSGNCKCQFTEGAPRDDVDRGRRWALGFLRRRARRSGAGQEFAARRTACEPACPTSRSPISARRPSCWRAGSRSARMPSAGEPAQRAED